MILPPVFICALPAVLVVVDALSSNYCQAVFVAPVAKTLSERHVRLLLHAVGGADNKSLLFGRTPPMAPPLKSSLPRRQNIATSDKFKIAAKKDSQLSGTESSLSESTAYRRSRNRVPKSFTGPTARYVAISALTDAATSTYRSCSSSGAGAGVNAASFTTRQLEQDEHFKNLQAKDRSFSRLLVATVERRMGQIDKVLACCMKRYPPKKGKYSKLVHATLRTGAAQLLFLQTPPFAAIKETVEVLRFYHKLESSPAAKNEPVPEAMIKFVNAVLRKLSQPSLMKSNEGLHQIFGEELLQNLTSPFDNISPWLLERLKNDWGEDKMCLICEETMPLSDKLKSHHVDLSTKYSSKFYSGNESPGEREQMLQQWVANIGGDAILLPQGSIRAGTSHRGDLKSWPGYEEGVWWVQDASATLPALVLIGSLQAKNAGHFFNGDLGSAGETNIDELIDTLRVTSEPSHSNNDRNKERNKAVRKKQNNFSSIHVVDMCAAPGGKTAQLLSAGFGRVTAIEASSRRSRRLVENLERLGLLEKCDIVIKEGQHWMPSKITLDRIDKSTSSSNNQVHGILLDVPCSATGTAARRPDVLRRDCNLDGLLKTQEGLANHCVDNILSAGGIMVYATCSILKEESEEQVARLIERGNGNEAYAQMKTLPIEPFEIPGYENAIDENGWLRVLPGVLKGELRATDGFFAARLIKIG